MFVILDNALVLDLDVLLFGQSNQIGAIGLFLLLQAINCRVHVDSEGDDNVKSDNDPEVIEDDEKDSVKERASFDINTHLDDDIPIIDNNQDEQRDIRRHQIVEVDQVVVVWDRRVVHDLGRVASDFSSEYDHTNLGEAVHDDHHDNNQVVKWTEQVLEGLKDDSHDLDFVEKNEQLCHPNQDDDFEDFDSVVVLLVIACVAEEGDHGWDIEKLAQCLRPNSEMIAVSLNYA